MKKYKFNQKNPPKRVDFKQDRLGPFFYTGIFYYYKRNIGKYFVLVFPITVIKNILAKTYGKPLIYRIYNCTISIVSFTHKEIL